VRERETYFERVTLNDAKRMVARIGPKNPEFHLGTEIVSPSFENIILRNFFYVKLTLGFKPEVDLWSSPTIC